MSSRTNRSGPGRFAPRWAIGVVSWSLALVLACAEAPDDGAAEPDDDALGDDAGDDDTGGGAQALVILAGEAIADTAGYGGTEVFTAVADQGQGETLCAIRYDWQAVAPQDDCPGCEWAWDLVATNAELVAEAGVGCAGVGASPADHDGEQRSQGFVSEYVGHADVLMALVDGTWQAVAFAAYDPETGALSYEWETGYQPYE